MLGTKVHPRFHLGLLILNPFRVVAFPLSSSGSSWGDEKEVPLVLKLDPIFIPFKFNHFKNKKLTI
jgi:hypothetical protein